MSEYHLPAMVQETLDGLRLDPDGVYVDATYGGGGHSKAILQKLSAKGRLISFDQDEQAIQNKAKDEIQDGRLTLIHSNFRFIYRYLKYYDIPPVDGLLADLGVSSHQLDKPDRGFAFRHKELNLSLDMRMNQSQDKSAADLINQSNPAELEFIFKTYGEIWNAEKLVKAIQDFKKKQPVSTIAQFIQIAEPHTMGPLHQYLAKAFQGLRIAVNDEMGALKQMLEDTDQILKPGGRLVVISYHSLEDRMVKHLIQFGNPEGIVRQDMYGNKIKTFEAITKKAISPSDKEIKENYRVRSARLRVAEKSAK
ncbi:MAG: 16S rRNA (cytosine(1402)-N(4))-methyltransferase RsmH [Saprospiraceae bacterium]